MLDDIFNKELQLIRDNPSIELQAKNAYKNELQLLREQVVYALKENLGCIRTECINTYKNFLTANGLENPTAHCKAAERTHTT